MTKWIVLILLIFAAPVLADDTTTVERTYPMTECNWMDQGATTDNNGVAVTYMRVGVRKPGIPSYACIGLMAPSESVLDNINDSLNTLADSIICCSLLIHKDAITATMASGDTLYVRSLAVEFSESESYYNRRKVDTNWTTAGANGSGTDYYANLFLAVSPADSTAAGWFRLDITDQARAWMDATESDTIYNGHVIDPKQTFGDDYMDWSSDDHGTSEYRPSLYMKYLIVTVESTGGTEDRHGKPNRHGAYLH